MNSKDRQSSVSRADLANATLVTITNNIGSIAKMCAINEKIEKVRLALALSFYVKNQIKSPVPFAGGVCR